MRFWPIESVLHDKYLLPKEEADLIGSFLTPMLRLNPERRARASEMTHHQWLEGIAVQGEIDQIRATEERERQKKEVFSHGGDFAAAGDAPGHGHKRHASSEVQEQPPSAKRLSGVVPNGEADALKPVDEGMPLSATADITPPHTSSTPSQHHQQHRHQHHSASTASTTAVPQLSEPPNPRDRSSASHGTKSTTPHHHHHHHGGEMHTTGAAAPASSSSNPQGHSSHPTNENPVHSQRLVSIP